jgi:DNA-binding MarR family transcriptional regulator
MIRKESTEVQARIFNDRFSKIGVTNSVVLVYMLISAYTNRKGKCLCSLETIIKDSGVMKPTVIKAIKKLEELEYIEIIKTKGRPDIYIVL